MTDGYYWYFPSDTEAIPDLQGKPQIVEVFDDGHRVAVCGSDLSYDRDECTGVFFGPLRQPER